MLFLMTGGNSEEASVATRTQYSKISNCFLVVAMSLTISVLGEALESLKYQQANYTAWLNGTESNFTMVCLVLKGSYS